MARSRGGYVIDLSRSDEAHRSDLFTSRVPLGDCIIDHATHRGWLKIGKFQAEGWKEQEAIEKKEQDGEGRRLQIGRSYEVIRLIAARYLSGIDSCGGRVRFAGG